MVQIKIVQDSVSYWKLSGRIGLSFPGVELGAFKIDMFEIL